MSAASHPALIARPPAASAAGERLRTGGLVAVLLLTVSARAAAPPHHGLGIGSGMPAAEGQNNERMPGERVPGPMHMAQRPGYLGVSLRDLDAAEVTRLQVRSAVGAMIVTVDRDAPAWTAGLRPQDVVLEIDGQPVEGVDMLRKRLRDFAAGETITVRVRRGSSEMSFAVTLGDQDAIAQDAFSRHLRPQTGVNPFVEAAPAPPPPTGARGMAATLLDTLIPGSTYTGLEVDPLTPQLAAFFGLHAKGGLLVTAVGDGSPAAEAGLQAGDVIVRARNKPVTTRSGLARSVNEVKEGAVPLAVLRDHQELVLNLLPRKRKKL